MREITLVPVSDQASERGTASPRTSQAVRSISECTDLTAGLRMEQNLLSASAYF